MVFSCFIAPKETPRQKGFRALAHKKTDRATLTRHQASSCLGIVPRCSKIASSRRLTGSLISIESGMGR